MQYRGHACTVRATPSTVRHFFAMDKVIGRALASYGRRRKANKATRAAARVWREFRDLAALAVARKADGSDLRVFTQAKPARR